MNHPLIRAGALPYAECDGSDRQRCNSSDRDRQSEWLQIGEELIFTADLAEFLALIGELDAVQVTAPLIVERAEQLITADNPELVVVQNDFVAD